MGDLGSPPLKFGLPPPIMFTILIINFILNEIFYSVISLFDCFKMFNIASFLEMNLLISLLNVTYGKFELYMGNLESQ